MKPEKLLEKWLAQTPREASWAEAEAVLLLEGFEIRPGGKNHPFAAKGEYTIAISKHYNGRKDTLGPAMMRRIMDTIREARHGKS